MSFISEKSTVGARIGDSLARVLTDPDILNAPVEELRKVKQHLARHIGPETMDWGVVEHFLGLIALEPDDALPADVDQDFTDNRYWVWRAMPKNTLKGNDALTLSQDGSYPKRPVGNKKEGMSPRLVVATNLSEDSSSHIMPDGSPVHVFGIMVEKSPTPIIHYYFHAGGGDNVWVVTPMANCIRGGVYSGQGYRTSAVNAECGSGTETNLPEGMTTPQNVIIINTEENGLATHWLKQNSWTFGVQRGVDDNNQPIIFVTGGYYRTASPQTIGRTDPTNPPLSVGEGLNAGITGNTWDRDTSDKPVEIYSESEVWSYAGNCNSPGDPNPEPKLMGRKRLMSFDAAGRLVSVTYENEFVIAVGCCPQRNSLTSPAFAPSFASFEEAINGSGTGSNLI